MRIDEQFVYDKIEEWGGMVEVDQSVKLITDYQVTDFYPRKNGLLTNWEIDNRGIYELIISVFTATLTNEEMTYQAMVGMLNHKIKLPDEINRIEVYADIIGLISSTGLIDITSTKGEYHMLSTDYELGEAIPQDDKHTTITLRPQPVESNYDRETGSLLLGHSMNHHEGYLRLSHINRMNNIPFKIYKDFVDSYEEAPKHEPVSKDEIIQWECHKEEALNKYEELVGQEAKFHIRHKYCTRGRCYSGSYYINPQGSSFKKAVVQLYRGEVVEGF